MAPQIIILCFFFFNFLIAFKKHGELKPELSQKYNIWLTIVDSIITISLLYWGGFFNVFFK